MRTRFFFMGVELQKRVVLSMQCGIFDDIPDEGQLETILVENCIDVEKKMGQVVDVTRMA